MIYILNLLFVKIVNVVLTSYYSTAPVLTLVITKYSYFLKGISFTYREGIGQTSLNRPFYLSFLEKNGKTLYKKNLLQKSTFSSHLNILS